MSWMKGITPKPAAAQPILVRFITCCSSTARMKTIITLFSLTVLWCFALAIPASASPLSDRVQRADVIAIVSFLNASTATHTNAAGIQITAFSANAVIERTLKGSTTTNVYIKGEAEPSVFQNGKPVVSRFLVFLRGSGGVYSLSDSDGLATIWGTGTPRECRVLWPNCTSLEEAEVAIQKVLARSGVPRISK